jgi:hypothetical protein
MAQLQPEEILKILEDQAREDDALDAEAVAIARMSDDELDAALAEHGVTPAMVAKSVEALLGEAGMAPEPDPPPPPLVAIAVPQPAPVIHIDARRKRRRIAWVLAAAAGTAAAGGAIYAATHATPSPAPAPPSPREPPAPVEPPGPVEQAPPIAQSPPVPPPAPTPAGDLRRRAAVALDHGDPAGCLRLLDQARAQDPAGDAAPETRALRKRAQAALQPRK